MEFQVSRPDLVRVGLVHGVYGNAAYTLGDQDIQAMHGVEVAMEACCAPRDDDQEYTQASNGHMA